MREQLIAAINERLVRVETTQDPDTLLVPEAIEEVRQLSGLVGDNADDVEALHTLGWWVLIEIYRAAISCMRTLSFSRGSCGGHQMARVLILATSHGQLGTSGLLTGVGLQTLAAPYYVLTDVGVEVVVASPLGGDLPIDPLSFGDGVETAALQRFLDDPSARALVRTSQPLQTATERDYDGLFVAGGHGGMWDLPDDPIVAALVAAALRAELPVAAVCHGVAALCGFDPVARRPVAEGRKVTALTNREESKLEREDVVPFRLQDRLMELGAVFAEEPEFTSHVVTDGPLITGQNMRSADEAARTLLAALGPARASSAARRQVERRGQY